MDNSVLRKRLQTFKSSNGTLRDISDEVVIDVLRAWEKWPGTTADLYRDLDITKMQLVTIIKKAKKLVKAGVVTESEFHEVALESPPTPINCVNQGIEFPWKNDKIIRFPSVDLLVDFLNKVA